MYSPRKARRGSPGYAKDANGSGRSARPGMSAPLRPRRARGLCCRASSGRLCPRCRTSPQHRFTNTRNGASGQWSTLPPLVSPEPNGRAGEGQCLVVGPGVFTFRWCLIRITIPPESWRLRLAAAGICGAGIIRAKYVLRDSLAERRARAAEIGGILLTARGKFRGSCSESASPPTTRWTPRPPNCNRRQPRFSI